MSHQNNKSHSENSGGLREGFAGGYNHFFFFFYYLYRNSVCAYRKALGIFYQDLSVVFLCCFLKPLFTLGVELND